MTQEEITNYALGQQDAQLLNNPKQLDAEVGTKGDTKGDTKDPTFADNCKSPERLRIAAMAMAGILSKGELADPDEVTDMALIYADELIEKCEEGGTL